MYGTVHFLRDVPKIATSVSGPRLYSYTIASYHNTYFGIMLSHSGKNAHKNNHKRAHKKVDHRSMVVTQSSTCNHIIMDQDMFLLPIRQAVSNNKWDVLSPDIKHYN